MFHPPQGSAVSPYKVPAPRAGSGGKWRRPESAWRSYNTRTKGIANSKDKLAEGRQKYEEKLQDGREQIRKWEEKVQNYESELDVIAQEMDDVVCQLEDIDTKFSDFAREADKEEQDVLDKLRALVSKLQNGSKERQEEFACLLQSPARTKPGACRLSRSLRQTGSPLLWAHVHKNSWARIPEGERARQKG